MMFFGLFILGVLIGAAANFAVATLAYFPRKISPWCRAPRKRPWFAYVPVLGWLAMRRESDLHGKWFWIRPMIVELSMGFLTVYLYQFIVLNVATYGNLLGRSLLGCEIASLNVRFCVQLLFVLLMLVASLIDIDETTIPDSVTVTGTVFALLVALTFPIAGPQQNPQSGGGVGGYVLQSPSQLYFFPEIFWPEKEHERPLLYPLTASAPFPSLGVMRAEGPRGLIWGAVCWVMWIFALMDRRFPLRRGWKVGWEIFVRRIARAPSTRLLIMLGNIGLVLILYTWFQNSEHWLRLHSALVGMGIAGGGVWILRCLSALVMRREAMGFGDVLLMAMFGAFLGWQPCLILFFLAPFAALVVGIAILIFARDSRVPYGPFLCIAALVTIFNWPLLWGSLQPIFLYGNQLWVFAAACVVLMVALLYLIQLVKRLLGIRT